MPTYFLLDTANRLMKLCEGFPWQAHRILCQPGIGHLSDVVITSMGEKDQNRVRVSRWHPHRHRLRRAARSEREQTG